MRRTYTFFISHRHHFDGYWVLPIINYLSSKNKINIVFLFYNDLKYLKKFLPKKNLKIFFLKSENKNPPLTQFFIKIKNKIGIEYISSYLKIHNLIKNSHKIYLSFVRNQKKFDKYRLSILKLCEKYKKILYLYPPVSSEILFDIPRTNVAKKIFVTTEDQMNYLKKKNILCEFVGAPHLHPSYIRQKLKVFKKEKVFKKNKNILLVLKNENANIFNYINYKELTLFTLNELSKLNYNVLIKPHPQQNLLKLLSIINNSKLKKYQITNQPIFFLSKFSSKVFTQYSGGILDILSAGKIPYLFWPVDKFLINKKKLLSTKILRNVVGTNLSDAVQYSDYSIKINNVKEINSKRRYISLKKFKFQDRYIKKLDYKIFD